MFVVPFGNVVWLNVIVHPPDGARFTMILTLAVLKPPIESVAVAPIPLKLPFEPQVAPEIVPSVLTVMPTGSAELGLAENVYGATPPEAER